MTIEQNEETLEFNHNGSKVKIIKKGLQYHVIINGAELHPTDKCNPLSMRDAHIYAIAFLEGCCTTLETMIERLKFEPC